MARRSAEEATPRLLKSFEDYLGEDEDTEKLFWMVLAAAQFETGRMLPEVRDRALAIIEGGGDVNRWLEDGDEVLARQRLRVLERLAEKLRGPQPKPKRLRRRRDPQRGGRRCEIRPLHALGTRPHVGVRGAAARPRARTRLMLRVK